jgi:hypothetical protein
MGDVTPGDQSPIPVTMIEDVQVSIPELEASGCVEGNARRATKEPIENTAVRYNHNRSPRMMLG